MIEATKLLKCPTRFLLFTGKGGVGKTSLACATAVALADTGKRVLLVSTDPASNLDEVLETRLSSKPTPVAGITNLAALNIDPVAAAHTYLERVVGPYRGILPAAAIASMEEQLSGACTVEIAAFDEFTKLVGDLKATVGYDHVLFDTAPTGHTLRLLSLPGAWARFISTNSTGTSCLGPLAGLQAQRDLYEASLQRLCSPDETTLILVSRTESSALAEAEKTRSELHWFHGGPKSQSDRSAYGICSTQNDSPPINCTVLPTGRKVKNANAEILQELLAFLSSECCRKGGDIRRGEALRTAESTASR
jgi:arsenite/tail-anchored protein-transporting ATPase